MPTTFTIYFTKTDRVEHVEEDIQKAPRKTSGDETILVVEDNEAVLQALKAGLEIFGYKVITANGGDRAAALIEQNTKEINMLITDVIMPGRSGKSVAALFREKFQEQPIIFISGYSMDIDPSTTFYHGVGCNECNQTGMTGRTGIYELLRITGTLRELIATRQTTEQIIKAAPADHVSMVHDGLTKVLEGITTPEEIFRVAKSIGEDDE